MISAHYPETPGHKVVGASAFTRGGMSEEAKKLLALLFDLAEAGDCMCISGRCHACQLRVQYGEVPETVLNELKKLIDNEQTIKT